MSDLTGGARANLTGKTAEDCIASCLSSHGLTFERQKLVGLTIYELPLQVDFWLPPSALASHPIIIESKWQGSAGSADEKFAYLERNIRERFPCPAIVVLDGPGFRLGAQQWLQNQVDGTQFMHLFTLAQFMHWLNKGGNVK